MIGILYKFLNKTSSKIIETVFVNLLTDLIGFMLVDFFTSYQFYTMIVVFLFSIVVVWWLERIGINAAFLSWIETKYIRTNLVTQIFEANTKLTVKQFIRNFYLCTKEKLELTEEELKEKLYKTCNYLITSDGELLTTDRHFELIFTGEDKDKNLWITPDGFEKWVKKAKIRLP